MMLPPDAELQNMTREQLERLWESRPQYPETASEMDWIRLAKELRYRKRHEDSRKG